MCWCAPIATAPVAGGRFPPPSLRCRRRRGRSVRADASPEPVVTQRKKVAVAGAGWAGLAAAHHLVKQGYEVTLLGAESGPTEEVGLRGFWYPYRNIFSLVDELGISPFTGWTKAAYYSSQGLAVEFPIFHDQPRLPAPFGMLTYPEFPSLPLIDRLTSIPVMAAVIDFDNTDTAWMKYDAMSARDLFKMFGCSQKLYKEIFQPAIQAALFAPGLKFYGNRVPTSLAINKDTACISGIVCGEEVHEADAFVLANGLSSLQYIIKNSPFLQSRQEFVNLLHLSMIDVVSIKLWFDKKITIPKVANVCSGFDDPSGWTFFDLTSIYDDYADKSTTIVEAEFYNASHLLPLNDEQIVSEASSHLIKCIQDFEEATVIQQLVRRCPKSTMHFLPGSYKYTVRGSTTLPNLFIAGDWIVNRHGSFSKEKAYVTGLEAANRVVDYFGDGDFAKIIAVEEDEPHIETARNLNRRANELKTQIPFSDMTKRFILYNSFRKKISKATGWY
uniref:Amine oxidase domain-containing protein n=1 Tax=Oryza barthii TaxID=65489 RepID=A0A0D3FYW1_9ORYZ